jgi:hypothetical protein
MSGVAIVAHLLVSAAGVTAVVPASRIKAGVLPQKTTVPAISVSKISAQQHNTLAQNSATYMVTERVQVTVLAKDYVQMKQIQALVRAALPQTRATVNGFVCDALYPDNEGPDLYDHEDQIHAGSADYRVSFRR